MTCDLPVMLNNQHIPRAHSFICLGVELDENLNSNERIQAISGIGTMKRIKPFEHSYMQPYFY
jgi:hypothetical protein